MAKILRPRRGKKATMETNATVLAKGEVFFEVPDTGVGTGACQVKMGDGSTAYSSLPYAITNKDIIIMKRNGAGYPYTDAKELSDYSWSDFQTMVDNEDFPDDVVVGNYKTITVNGYSFKMTIIGINTHKNYINSSTYGVNSNIDFCSRECYPDTVQWNTTATNNGTADEPRAYLASNVYSYLTNTLYPLLPSDVKAVISNRYEYLPTRYSSSSTLTTDSYNSTYNWGNIGYLWLPNETEVYGHIVFGSPEEGRAAYQYPYFRDGAYTRVKYISGTSTKCHWWLHDVVYGSSKYACDVHDNGHANYRTVTQSDVRVPLCFRIQS